jgi:cytochrome oxidase Cu insertion factor (SCO1/SenC/PrrC family)
MNMPKLKFALSVLLVMVLQSCNQPPNWNASDISGAMPDLKFTLTGPDGERVDSDSLSGKPLLLFFGFTSCPDVCPTTLTRFRESYGVYASMQSSDSKGTYNVMHSAAVFAFDAQGQARLLISDLDDSDAVVSDLKQLIDL